MSNNYIENMIERIRDSIQKERYITVGNKFYMLEKYGIIVKNKLLVLLASELTDVFRNSLSDYKKSITEYDKGEITLVIESVFKLLEYLNQDFEDLNENQKAQIFDLLATTIYNAERIQDISAEIAQSRIRTYRRSFEEDFG